MGYTSQEQLRRWQVPRWWASGKIATWATASHLPESSVNKPKSGHCHDHLRYRFNGVYSARESSFPVHGSLPYNEKIAHPRNCYDGAYSGMRTRSEQQRLQKTLKEYPLLWPSKEACNRARKHFAAHYPS